MIRNVSLAAQIAPYAESHLLCHEATYRFHRSIDLLGSFLGHTPTVDDLTDATISAWTAWLDRKYAPWSVHGYQADVLALWRGLADVAPPVRVRRAKIPRPLPIAWTREELAAILRVCGQLTGVFPSGAPRSLYCIGLVRAAWSTGLRRSDLWRLDRNRVRPDGAVILRQHKTGAPHQPRFRPATYEIWTQLPGIRPLANPYRTEKAWYTFWRVHVIEPAGVRPGCLQQLRRSGATHLASEHPEAVQRYLGHASPEMGAWYVDWSIARPQQFLPPELT